MEASERFDFVIIDGGNRFECARKIDAFLKKSGVVLWDDTECNNDWRILEKAGFRSLHFSGMRPQVIHLGQTSLFYRDGNCLGI